MSRPLKKLSKRHKVFVQHYMESFNASESAIKAGCSVKNSYNSGSLWLKEPLIRDYMAQMFKEAELSDEELKGIVSDIARDKDDKSNCLRANELMAKIKGIVKSDANQHVNVMVDATQRTEDILSKRFSKADTVS